MADVALVSNNFACIADVLAIVTAEAAREVQVADVVGMRLPVSLHLREEISLKYAFDFGDGAFNLRLFL